MNGYLPIPVETAKQISEQFQKSQVVILAFDPQFQVTHTTTYGVSPFDKENAAAVGQIATKAIGCDLSKKQDFEDFHHDYDPARYKASTELLKSALCVLNAHAVGFKTQEAIQKFLDQSNQQQH